MHVREYQPKDYEVLCQWWKDWGWLPIDQEILPRYGWVVEDEKPVVAGFMYRTDDKKMAFFEFIVADKNVEGFKRAKALMKLLKTLVEEAKKEDVKLIYTCTANESLISTYQKLGLEKLETNVTTLGTQLSKINLNCLK